MDGGGGVFGYDGEGAVCGTSAGWMREARRGRKKRVGVRVRAKIFMV